MPTNPCFIERASNQEIDDGIKKMGGAEFASKFWRYTKDNYTAKGVMYPEALPKLAKEFNIPERVVSRILDHNKTVRNVAEDVAKTQAQNRKFLADNRRYIAKASQSDAAKLLSMVHDGTRSSLMALHGPVIAAIHPIDLLFTPGRWGAFMRQYGRAVKAASPSTTLKMMERLKGQERYQEWVDAGLPLEPHEHLEGMSVGGWGGRAMDAALKPLMYELAEQLYSKEAPELRNKVMMQDIAEQASFAAGAIPKGFLGHGKLVSAYSGVQLARSLNTARWMKAVFDPIKTISTYAQTAIGKASRALPEKFHRPIPDIQERRAASRRTWQAGRWAGTMAGALILNDQVNRLLGGSRVNLTDPKRGDYMAFKVTIPGVGEYYIRTRGSMEVLSLAARLGQGANPYAHSKYGERTPEEIAGRYFEYKITPSASLGKELTTGKDVFGRPVPWSADPGTKYAPRYSSLAGGPGNSLKDRVPRGITSTEYIGQHFPIFLGHGVGSFYEGLRESGINPRDAQAIMRGIQQHPSLVARPLVESAGEFIGLNLQRIHGAKPYRPPQAQQKLEDQYLPTPRK